MRYFVGKFDPSQFTVPEGDAQRASGYERASLVDHNVGSVHMGAAICRLHPGGRVDSRIHANEKGIYVLEGQLEIKRGAEAFKLAADDYALVPYGVAHALRNTGDRAALWFEMQAPQPKPPGGWQDTLYSGDNDWPAQVAALDLDRGNTKMVGRFAEQRSIGPAGEVISGLKVYRFMEQNFGAQLFYMMRGVLAPGGVRGRHDHTVEEFYFALSGEAFMDIEGERFHLRRGDVAWTGVGASHAFHHTGDVPFRWIETQAPQFPARSGTRNYIEWEKLRTGS